mgnify:CR=1 FL=1
MTESSRLFLSNLQKVNMDNCRASLLGRSNLVTCLSCAGFCSWRQSIGGNALCTHTLNFMIADATSLAAQVSQPTAVEAGSCA